ncbi:MAG TPA: hypothetical protein VN761_05765, partial [Candidatus Polarisedimenticolia bacterium]|nr:hypothetical protein [Candidatus Polarisedimenticolia bacterium]
MNRLRSHLTVFFFSSALAVSAATLPSDWQHQQPFTVSTPGLVKLSIPLETLDAARPGLDDLRVYDDVGNELPYAIEHPAPANKIIRRVQSFQTSLNPQSTIITIQTGLQRPLSAITLETPANNFIKSVQVESSLDGQNWQSVAQGKVIFRQ